VEHSSPKELLHVAPDHAAGAEWVFNRHFGQDNLFVRPLIDAPQFGLADSFTPVLVRFSRANEERG